MAAIGQYLGANFLFQQHQGARQPRLVTGQAERCGAQTNRRRQARRTGRRAGQIARQVFGLRRQAHQQAIAEYRIGAVHQQGGIAAPGLHPAAQHVCAPDQRLPAFIAVQPRGEHGADMALRRLAAGGTKVTQPGKAVQFDGKAQAAALRQPRHVARALRLLVAKAIAALEKAVGDCRFARPRIVWPRQQRHGRLAAQQQVVKRAGEKPLAERHRAACAPAAPFSRAILPA